MGNNNVDNAVGCSSPSIVASPIQKLRRVEYWEKGNKCHGYHELFFNGLFLVLYRGIGNNAVGILISVKVFQAYHFERLIYHQKNSMNSKSCLLNSGSPMKSVLQPSQAKETRERPQTKGWRNRKLVSVPRKLFKIIQIFLNAGLGGVLLKAYLPTCTYTTYPTYLHIFILEDTLYPLTIKSPQNIGILCS